MHWKIFTVIAMVVVMLMTVPPVKVKAQALLEFAISLSIMVLGPGERGEIYWVNTRQGNPQKPVIQPGDFPNRYYTIVITNTSDTACSQTIQAQITAYPGRINTLTLAKKGDKLFINGEESKDSLIPCNSDALRNAYWVGVPFPPGLENLTSAEANALASQLPSDRVVSYAISDDTGDTHAFAAGINHLKSKTVGAEVNDDPEP